VITAGLVDLGILRGNVSRLIARKPTGRFTCIGSDTGWDSMCTMSVTIAPAGEWRELEAGMVLTVEPGIYIAPDNADVPGPGAVWAFVSRTMC
jgi:Xaa-Pro aminopeptidase